MQHRAYQVAKTASQDGTDYDPICRVWQAHRSAHLAVKSSLSAYSSDEPAKHGKRVQVKWMQMQGFGRGKTSSDV